MKRNYKNVVSLVCFGMSTVVFSQNVTAANVLAPLLFTEYLEGSGFNKALEISNTGLSPVNLSDYSIRSFRNGSLTSTSEILLEGSLNSRESFVIANARADEVIPADMRAYLAFNGDDYLELNYLGEVIDHIGQRGVDPGTQWGSPEAGTRDQTMRRLQSVTSGNTLVDQLFDPAEEWSFAGKDNFEDLGQHVSSVPIPGAWLLLASGLVFLRRIS